MEYGKWSMIDNLVSVVVTCYNHEKYIEQCLRSIFSQTFQNLELFVWNDGSTDSSETIIKQTLLDSPFEKTVYHVHENQGLVKTRNQALEYINGDFILFVDSDNYLENNYLEEMLSVAHENNADIIYTNLIDPKTQEYVLKARYFDLQEFYIGNYIDSCSLVRTSKIDEITYDELFNYKKLEDYDFFFNLILKKNAKPHPAYGTHLNYRVLEDSMSARSDYRKYYDSYSRVLGKYYLPHPKFAEVAMQMNFQLLESMSNLEAIYRDQGISIYFDFGDGFTENNRLYCPLKDRDEFTFKIPYGAQYFKIGFTINPIYFYKLNIQLAHTRENLTPLTSNGIRVEKGMNFLEDDPTLIYHTTEFSEDDVLISYTRSSLSNIHSFLFPANYLTEIIQERDLQLLTVGKEKKLQSVTYEQKIYELNQQYEELYNQYHKVTGSLRWIIPTKIINFFRRK